LNIKIKVNNKEWVVHVNREHSVPEGQWSPPLFQYHSDDSPASATHEEPLATSQSGPPENQENPNCSTLMYLYAQSKVQAKHQHVINSNSNYRDSQGKTKLHFNIT